MSACYPFFLIVGDDGCTRRAEDEAQAKGADDFSVSQVRDDLAHRPLLRSGTPVQFGSCYTLDEAIELLGGCRLHDKRLLAFHVTKNSLGVLLWCFLHFILRSRPWSMEVLRSARGLRRDVNQHVRPQIQGLDGHLRDQAVHFVRQRLISALIENARQARAWTQANITRSISA